MNENIFRGKWKQLKGEVRKQWGKLTNDDIDRINGSYQELVGRVQERYGYAVDEAQTRVADWFESMADAVGQDS